VHAKEVREKDLIFPETDHPELDVICAIQAFYLMVEELSQDIIIFSLKTRRPKRS